MNIKTRKYKTNPTFDDFIVVSRKQVELAIYIRQFRRIHQFSQQEMASLCTKFGEPSGIKFHWTEISCYENYKTIPRQNKFQILMNVMDLDPTML
jgi:hypothetical protein